MSVKFAVWAHTDGRLRFNTLGPDKQGFHETFDAEYDTVTRIATLRRADLDQSLFDPTTPLFLREFFGEDGKFELFGHLSIQNPGNVFEYLQMFSARVFSAVAGRKNQCVDDPNRYVFWKAVDYLATSGPLNLCCIDRTFGMSVPISPRFNF